MTQLGWKTAFFGLANEIWEVRRVLTQKPRKFNQASVNYGVQLIAGGSPIEFLVVPAPPILNQDVPLLASHLYYSFQNVLDVCIGSS